MSADLPARKNLKIFPESSWRYRFEWAVEEEKIVEPVDLTGFTGRWVIMPAGEADTVLTSTLNAHGSGVVFNGISGFIDLKLAQLDVEALKWRQANFRLFVIDPSTKESEPLMRGTLSVVS